MQKWEGKKTNFKIGDIVILYQDNVSRNHWPMAKIINVNSNKKGLVLCATMHGEAIREQRELQQSIDKMVLILGSDEIRFPTEKAMC